MTKTLTYTLFLCLLTFSCDTQIDQQDAAAESESGPQNNSGLDGGVCCKITRNFTDSSLWNNRNYYCVQRDAALDPFNPPWICDVDEGGSCGGEGQPECKSCLDDKCIVGMMCLGVNGTGNIIACQ